jgi:hypothetical protein
VSVLGGGWICFLFVNPLLLPPPSSPGGPLLRCSRPAEEARVLSAAAYQGWNHRDGEVATSGVLTLKLQVSRRFPPSPRLSAPPGLALSLLSPLLCLFLAPFFSPLILTDFPFVKHYPCRGWHNKGVFLGELLEEGGAPSSSHRRRS